MRYETWTPEQERILYENANLGARACRDIIYRETGVRREEEAVRRHANRLGISMRKWAVCPACSATVDRLVMGTGLCPTCSERYHAERNRLRIKTAAEIRASEEYKRARREYDAARQAAARSAKTPRLPFTDECPKDVLSQVDGGVFPENEPANDRSPISD